MNKKIIVSLLVGGILISGMSYASAGFHHFSEGRGLNSLSGATLRGEIELTDEQKALMEEHFSIKEKLRNGETLTTDEQTILDTMRNTTFGNMGRDGKMGHHKMNFMTSEEKETLSSMTDEEKQNYFKTKMEEQRVKQESHENVLDKILNGETLTSDEELIKQEIIQSRNERKNKLNSISQ